jgi:hypothetical protein
LGIKVKKTEHGAELRLKRRLVPKGHSQKPTISYNDSFEPVGEKRLSASYQSCPASWMQICQSDIDTASLIEYPTKTIYMILPEGFHDASGNGFKLSAREWFRNLPKEIGLAD